MRLLFTLLCVSLCGLAQEPFFTVAGSWDRHTLYAVSVCSATARTLPGNTIWAAAQRAGIRPLTRGQLQSEITESNKRSISAWLRTLGLVTTGSTTALQAVGTIGEEWADGWRAIAPAAGALLVIAELVAERQAPLTITIPDNYLPPTVQIPAGDCWVGTLIGDAQ